MYNTDKHNTTHPQIDGRVRIIANKDDSFSNKYLKGDLLAIENSNPYSKICSAKNLTRPRMTIFDTAVLHDSDYDFISQYKPKHVMPDEYTVKFLGIPLFTVKKKEWMY